MLRARDSMQAKVLQLAGCGRRLERVDDVNEFEVAAERRDLFGSPRAARLPAEAELAAFRLLEESLQSGNMFRGGGEARRALKEHQKCAEFLRHGEGFVPRPADGGVEAEVAAVLAVVIVEPGPLVGGAGCPMSDDLPGF